MPSVDRQLSRKSAGCRAQFSRGFSYSPSAGAAALTRPAALPPSPAPTLRANSVPAPMWRASVVRSPATRRISRTMAPGRPGRGLQPDRFKIELKVVVLACYEPGVLPWRWDPDRPGVGGLWCPGADRRAIKSGRRPAGARIARMCLVSWRRCRLCRCLGGRDRTPWRSKSRTRCDAPWKRRYK